MKGFTLLELLIVIGILAILASVVILVLNPAELVSSSRDAKRLSELNTLNKTMALYRFDNTTGFGTSSYVYLSLPDSSPNCLSYTLPNPPTGYTYLCKPESQYRKTDGTGWIPVNFSNISAGSALTSLPVDPVNNEQFHFTYTISNDDDWELTAKLQSQAKQPLASNEKDGGDDNTKYELGATLAGTGGSLGYQNTILAEPSLIAYWKMDNDWTDSKGSNNGTATGATFGTAKQGAASGIFDGIDDYVNIGSNLPAFTLTTFTYEAWVKVETSNYFSNAIVGTYADTTVNGAEGATLRIVSGYFDMVLYNNGGATNPIGTTLINDGNWHHVVAVNENATSHKLYVDGVLEANDTTDFTPLYPSDVRTSIGANYDTSETYIEFFNGLIDEVAFYNTALSASTISSHYTAGI